MWSILGGKSVLCVVLKDIYIYTENIIILYLIFH